VAQSIKAALICAMLALGGVPAIGQNEQGNSPPPAWEGVWQGTIGQARVHVCLERSAFDENGAYYYDRIKSLLRLVPADGSGGWFEQETSGDNGARWQFSERRGELVGTWSDGKKALPLRLERIGGPGSTDESPCGSGTFNKPRFVGFRTTNKPAVKDGTRYTIWSFKPGPWLADEVEITTFTLDRPGPAIAKVNAILRSALPDPDGSGDWSECVAGNVENSGMDGTFFEIIEPTLVTERWLAASDQGEYYCGGAHPESVDRRRTFDLARGIEVDPRDWLEPRAFHRENYDGEAGTAKTITPEFMAALLDGWKAENPDCDEIIRGWEWWGVGIERGALVFSPEFPRVTMACGEDIKMPFTRLGPWLNQEGKAARATLPG
jgi:hypothetical protein